PGRGGPARGARRPRPSGPRRGPRRRSRAGRRGGEGGRDASPEQLLVIATHGIFVARRGLLAHAVENEAAAIVLAARGLPGDLDLAVGAHRPLEAATAAPAALALCAAAVLLELLAQLP